MDFYAFDRRSISPELLLASNGPPAPRVALVEKLSRPLPTHSLRQFDQKSSNVADNRRSRYHLAAARHTRGSCWGFNILLDITGLINPTFYSAIRLITVVSEVAA